MREWTGAMGIGGELELSRVEKRELEEKGGKTREESVCNIKTASIEVLN